MKTAKDYADQAYKDLFDLAADSDIEKHKSSLKQSDTSPSGMYSVIATLEGAFVWKFMAQFRPTSGNDPMLMITGEGDGVCFGVGESNLNGYFLQSPIPLINKPCNFDFAVGTDGEGVACLILTANNRMIGKFLGPADGLGAGAVNGPSTLRRG